MLHCKTTLSSKGQKTNEERPHHIIFRGTVATTIRHIKAFPPGGFCEPIPDIFEMCNLSQEHSISSINREDRVFRKTSSQRCQNSRTHTNTQKTACCVHFPLESLRLSAHSIRKSWCNNHLGDSIASSALEAWDDRPEHLTR